MKSSAKQTIAFLFACIISMASGTTSATQVTVDAQANSSSGGIGLDSGIHLIAGQTFSVTVAPSDLWNAGALPRWSNANGLVSNLFATGSDDSGLPVGTQIGTAFGLWTQNGLSAPYGALIGELNDMFFFVGTNFSGIASATDTLKLYYWDSNNGDNTGSIVANVQIGSPIPEPASLCLLGLGIIGVFATRRRKS